LAHNQKVAGSSPAPATKKIIGVFMAEIINSVCDQQATENTMLLLGTTILTGGGVAFAYHKKAKKTKHKTLKTVGMYLAGSMVSGFALRKLYLEKEAITQSCQPYYESLQKV